MGAKIEKMPMGAAAHGRKTQLIGLRVPAHLIERIEKIAETESCSRSSVMIHLLILGLAHRHGQR